MLLEISCDQFISYGEIRTPIVFNRGLNTVMGDEAGSNSIGKSTFLMIVDFAFGGSDYIKKSTDVQKEVGIHTIKFAHQFLDEVYYFSRSTGDSNHVNICDSKYNVKENIKLDDFCKMLFKLNKIQLQNITFRGITSRFLRVYGRENLEEKRPLQNARDEKMADSIKSLLKLFDRYSVIIELEKQTKESKDKKTAFSKAQKYQFIPKINKTKFKNNEKDIERLLVEMTSLADKSSSQLLGLDAEQAEVLADLRQELSGAKRRKSRLHSQLSAINANLQSGMTQLQSNYEELSRFFPEVNIKQLSDIENFHSKIRTILESELLEAKENVTALLEVCETEIENYTIRIKSMGVTDKISKPILQKYSVVESQIKSLTDENEAYTKLQELKDEATILTDRLTYLEAEVAGELQNDINIQMDKLNDIIYDGTKKAPVLTIDKPNHYIFQTPNDNGTGTNYKGLIVFDLAILQLTDVPALAHDSILLKQIGDLPLEHILELYCKTEKQIFISLDKADSYTKRTQEILEKSKVLQLSENGNELFGHAWNDK